MSDMHFDKHHDKGESFVRNLNAEGVDALVIAGDMGEQQNIDFALDLMCEKFPLVIAISGNHNYWGSNKETVEEFEKVRSERHKNYEYLEDRVLEIQGKRILGCTLWYRQASEKLSRDWPDFHYIDGFYRWYKEKNKQSREFLENNIQEGDVVITHHLPSPKCVAPQFKGDPCNVFFVCNMEDVIAKTKPSLWIFGHTHTAFDKTIYDTRLVCNPYGYQGYENNTGYKEMDIEI